MSSILDDPPSDRIVCDTKSWSYSEIVIFQQKFLWAIQNFSQLPTSVNSQEPIQSETFEVGPTKEHIFLVRLYPYGKKLDCRNHIGLFLGLVETDVAFNEIFVKFKMSVTDAQGKIFQSRIKEGVFGNGTFRGWNQFTKRCEVLNRLSDPSTEDQLVVNCEIAYSNGSVNHQFVGKDNEGRSVSYESPTRRLAQDLGSLLSTKTASDLTLVVDAKKIPVHKAILSARSRVFAAMFENEMDETKLDSLEIKDLKEETVQVMIDFIYTGSVGIQPLEVSKELVIASHRYDLPHLKLLCEDNLALQISVDKVCDILTFAEEHKCQKLKGFALLFLKDNCNKVRETDDWKEMLKSKPELLHDVIEMFTVSNSIHETD